ncbi:unnamed protein product [Vitrella brassicaformis CCMP3155]|uniref:beta-glucosidase n=2 Tax=Vitrella brassicaformis TaxID=1169539 RepID=A0A0G4GQI0_VITBC|nr:unnamed protein product [Vitrella brassicaformis CCMP3155]|eukprot:CEM32697.1 unnamed protein product [Vitrella brassicaformis CCMP3155]
MQPQLTFGFPFLLLASSPLAALSFRPAAISHQCHVDEALKGLVNKPWHKYDKALPPEENLLAALTAAVEKGKKEGRKFLFGTSTVAFQVEGHSSGDGRHDSVWDAADKKAGRKPSEGAGFHDKFEQDIAKAKDMAFDAFHFSISWSRVMTKDNKPNHKGVSYYQRLVKAIKANGMEPIATLYHWDMPQGKDWRVKSTVDDFAAFAEVMYTGLPSVNTWITIHDPYAICHFGYHQGTIPPFVRGGEGDVEKCARSLLLAHARAVDVHRKKAPKDGGGKKIGFTLSLASDHPYAHPAGKGRRLQETNYTTTEYLRALQEPSGEDACIEKGIDFYGYDVFEVHAASPAECRVACQGHDGCLFFTYRADGPDAPEGINNCYLKTSDMGRTASEIGDVLMSGAAECSQGGLQAEILGKDDQGRDALDFQKQTFLDPIFRTSVSPLVSSGGGGWLTAEEKTLLADAKPDFVGIATYGTLNGASDQSVWLRAIEHAPLGKALQQLQKEYNPKEILVTQMGLVNAMEDYLPEKALLNDQQRIWYYHMTMFELAMAALHRGVRLGGMFAWSLVDVPKAAVQMSSGKVGLMSVSDDSKKERKIKESGNWFKHLIRAVHECVKKGWSCNAAADNLLLKPNGMAKAPNMPYEQGILPLLATAVQKVEGSGIAKPFMWGTATAAYQVEGGWNKGGRAPSIWDEFTHAEKAHNGHTGDVACDFFHKYAGDMARMKGSGFNAFRFSISWSRLMPHGKRNQAGVAFYKDVIKATKENGMQPLVTLYHWDLPAGLDWREKSVVDAYVKYADLVFSEFIDHVDDFITFNEPWVFCKLGYQLGIHAPGVKSTADDLKCGHHVLLAHGKAVKLFRSKYQRKGKRIGITLNHEWRVPHNPSDPKDVTRTQGAIDSQLGWFADPIYLGDYPKTLKARWGKKMPVFTPAEKELLKGSSDFFGLNMYTTLYESHEDGSSYERFSVPIGPEAASIWLYPAPFGVAQLLKYVQNRYNPPSIIITENGVSAVNEEYMPNPRKQKITLKDSFRFGLQYVDFDAPERPRYMKESAKYLGTLIPSVRAQIDTCKLSTQ